MESLRLQIDRLPLTYIEVDANHRILNWNPAAERMFGYSNAEAMGQICLDLIHVQPTNDQIMQVACRVDVGDMEANHVNENRTKDGRTIICEWFNTPLLDSEGKFAGVVSLVQDITERRRTEDANRQMAAIVASSDDAIIGKTLEGVIVSWNRGAVRTYGYQEDEMKGRSISVLVPPDRVDDVPRIFAEIKQGKSIEHFETVRRTKGGRMIDVSLTISPTRDVDGTISGASTIARDITERKHAEAALQESENRLTLAVAAADLGIFEHDHGSDATYWSPTMRRIFRWGDQDLASLPNYLGLIHPEDRAEVVAAVRSAHDPAGDGQYRIEHRIVLHDGSVRWVNILSRTTFAGIATERRPVRTIGTVADITDRKKADEKIALARDFYLKLLNHFPTPIWRAGLNGKCDYFNKTWLEFTGRTHDQELGDGWAEGVHPEDVGPCVKDYLDAFHARRPFELVYRLRRHDGAYRWIVDHGRPFDDLEGHFAGYIGSCYDITDDRKAMAELRESKKRVQALTQRLLAVREEERCRLARELHDGVSQTLTALALAFEIGMNAPPESRAAKLDESRKWLEKGLRQARDLANELRPAILDHLGLLPTVLWLIDRFKVKEKLNIHFRHDGLTAPVAPAVATIVYRLIDEGLRNVVRHADVSDVSLRLWAKNGLLNIQIEDEGIGFAHDTAFASGNKIELAAIQEQIELLGGKLDIHSNIGDGTGLMAQLPLVL